MNTDEDTLDPEAPDETGEVQPEQPPRKEPTHWFVRTVQVVLFVALVWTVAAGARRHWLLASHRAETTSSVEHQVKPAASSTTPTVATSQANRVTTENAGPNSASRQEPGLSLNSLNDLPVYLELHQTFRQTRGYELGLASPESVKHLKATEPAK